MINFEVIMNETN